jgi:integrase
MRHSLAAAWDNLGVSKVPKNSRYLVDKDGRFHFRIRIPDDLRATFGKKEHSEALGDINKAQAKVRVAQLGAHWQALFLEERHRQGSALSPPAPAPETERAFRVATLEEVKAVAALAAARLLQLDEENRIDGWSWPGGDSADFGSGRPLEEVVPEAIAGRNLMGLKDRAEDWLGAHGLDLPQDEGEQRRALYAWAQATAKALAGRKQRDRGEVFDTPPEPVMPESIAASEAANFSPADKPAHLLTLRDVLHLWSSKSKRPTPKTIDTAERIVAQFEEVLGNPPLAKLTRQHGLKFRDWLLAQGQSPRTAFDRLGYVRRLIRFEMQEQQRITVNPWDSIKIEGSRERVTVRKPIKGDKLAALFGAPLFQAYELPQVRTAGRDAAYWIPILGAYTGARVTELAQLLTTDIRQEGALWCISIMDEQAWQSVKNTSSKRVIPMHPELVRLGLPEYAASLRQAGHERLFPMAPVSDLNNAGGPFATWFSKLKARHGWGPENTFHSFRHTIETMLKRKQVYPFNINAYTGHKQKGGDADTTYSHPEPADLMDVAAAVVHEEVSLPRVFPPEGWEPPPLLASLLVTRPRR